MNCLKLHKCNLCDKNSSCEFNQKYHEDWLLQMRMGMIRKVLLVTSTGDGLGATSFSILLAKELAHLSYKIKLMDASMESMKLTEYLNYASNAGLEFTNNGVVIPFSDLGFSYISPFMFMLNNPQPLFWNLQEINNFVESIIFNVDWGEVDLLILKIPFQYLFFLSSLINFFQGKIKSSILFADTKFKNKRYTHSFVEKFINLTGVLGVFYSPSVINLQHNHQEFLGYSGKSIKTYNLPFVEQAVQYNVSHEQFLTDLYEVYSPITTEVAQSCLSIFSD